MGETIRVMTTPATVLRDAVDLAEKRDGEDRWDTQARTLGELGYSIVNGDEVGRLRDALALIDRNGCTRLTSGRCWGDYTRAAKSGADQWCDACVAAAALEGRSPGEEWQPGDVVLDASGDLWTRANKQSVRDGWPWSLGCHGSTGQPPNGGVAEYGLHSPNRPLALLVRDGKAVALNGQVDELNPQGGAR